jgi:Tfp pilus assembly protein PilN
MWNPLQKSSGPSPNSSFLPEDYLERKVELRTNFIYLTLFAVVIVGVVGAFFVTNRQWAEVKDHQETINIRYAQAAKDIEQLKLLEDQKHQMLGKAELTTALIEKAPRSVVLAELVNRMPERLTLLELELKSKRIETKGAKPAAGAQAAQAASAKQGRKLLSDKAPEAAAPAAGEAVAKAPKLEITLTIIGVAAAHTQVAEYIASLQQCKLLDKIELKFSEGTIINDRGLNKFRIETRIRDDADARQLDTIVEGARGAFGAIEEQTVTISPAHKEGSASAQPSGDGKEN